MEAVILRFARGRLLTARLVVMTLDKKHPKSEKMRRTDLILRTSIHCRLPNEAVCFHSTIANSQTPYAAAPP